jgi:hypothetical protein
VVDFKSKTDDEIETWIRNHERRAATDKPLYKALLEERARRQSSGLKLEISLQHLIQAAKEDRFTTYGDLAKASGVPWNVARHAMNGPHGHLDRLLDLCYARGMPLLTALCVNEEGRNTGQLGKDALKGFIAGAQRLGYKITDQDAFLRDCQDRSFSWAKPQNSIP